MDKNLINKNNEKKITITKEILDKLPEFNMFAYKFEMDVCESDEKIREKINELDEFYQKKSLEEVINLECIKEGRDAYKLLGKDPSRYRIACESLLRRLSKGNGLYYINNAVDLGNVLSIELNRSTAVLDYDKVIGDVRIRRGKETDIYEGIGRGIINVTNIPLYCDEVSPFGSPTSDTLRTSVDENSKNILLFVICFSEKYIDECKKEAYTLYKTLGNARYFEEIEVIKES